jgi:hypothetical protein
VRAAKFLFGKLNGEDQEGKNNEIRVSQPLQFIPQYLCLQVWADQLNYDANDGDSLPTHEPCINLCAADVPMSPSIYKYTQCQDQ